MNNSFTPGGGWGSGFMTREGTTGLIMVDIKERRISKRHLEIDNS